MEEERGRRRICCLRTLSCSGGSLRLPWKGGSSCIWSEEVLGSEGKPGTEEKGAQRGGKEKLTAPVGEESSAADPARGGSETEQVSIAGEC